jgi:uncharacterized protein
MSLEAKINEDMIAAMKARDAERTGTLRMVKAALKNKAIEKRSELTDAEGLQILTTMVKQRQDSIEQFTKGGRPELAQKEAEEIRLIEEYMPKSASEAEIRDMIAATIAELTASGKKPTAKDMGLVMKDVQAKIQGAGLRADGRQVSEIVKAELAK